eukprot:TRINITY_DN14001_c0_g1_i1.p1 TRINITY_DN14001_c0_g1~~TRINITY_DN14001_c0_g1_i1.p1  ORF type:complete len:527 (+),score=160.47 TRINITY_DN14001_c0_g1_i1:98-1582(+)
MANSAAPLFPRLPTFWMTENQHKVFSEGSHGVDDHSITTMLLTPFWNWVVHKVPSNVAPNVLSLAGLLCLMQAYYYTSMYSTSHPHLVTCAAFFLILCYQTLDAIAGKHAVCIMNESALVDLFTYSCSTIGAVFLSMTISAVLHFSLEHTWYLVQISQLLVLRVHVQAYKKGVRRVSLAGPGEALLAILGLFLVRVTVGFEWLHVLTDLIGVTSLSGDVLRYLYYGFVAHSLVKAMSLPYGTRNGIWFCLIYRSIPALLLYMNLFGDQTYLDVLCDGLFMSIITVDLIVARVVLRDLHQWVVIFAMCSLFSNFLTLALVVIYFVSLFSEIASQQALPIFTTVVNVYMDGIYDMCHLGHMRAFEQGAARGTRLFVGVVSDEDATPYKRPPIMKTQERCDAVAACKYVHKVIPGAPCNGLTEAFLKKWNIHVVCCGEEYFFFPEKRDKYYKVPHDMHILQPVPRTAGMSTSELIRRVIAHGKAVEAEEREQGRSSA